MTKQSRITLAALGLLIAALVAGFLGGRLGGNGSSVSAATGNGPEWITKIKKSGELRVGCADAPPTIVVKSDGTCTGPDLIPMENLAKEIGVKLVTKATTWQNIVAGLQAGRYDVAADLDQTVERTLSIQFTKPSWSYPGVYIVKRDSSHRTSADINAADKPPATTQGSAEDHALQAAGITPLRVDTYQNAANAVTAGRASAVFTDLGVAVDFATKDPSWGIIVPDPAIFVHYVAYGVPSDVDPQSMQAMNVAIDNSVASGEIDRGFAKAGYKELDKLGDLQIKP
jgi:polar amino acid transport system substrate-binding protein